jgi:hypothetical protein
MRSLGFWRPRQWISEDDGESTPAEFVHILNSGKKHFAGRQLAKRLPYPLSSSEN